MIKHNVPKFIPGDHWIMCELCGINYRRSECAKNWKGQMVCKETCFETRHPQDFVKVRPDVARPQDPRPDSNITFATTSIGTVTAADLHEYDGTPL